MGSSPVKTTSRADSKSKLHEKHYTVAEVAKIKHLSPATVRRIVQDYPGVFRYESSNKGRKRRTYVTLRIPESVVEQAFAKYYRMWNEKD